MKKEIRVVVNGSQRVIDVEDGWIDTVRGDDDPVRIELVEHGEKALLLRVRDDEDATDVRIA